MVTGTYNQRNVDGRTGALGGVKTGIGEGWVEIVGDVQTVPHNCLVLIPKQVEFGTILTKQRLGDGWRWEEGGVGG